MALTEDQYVVRSAHALSCQLGDGIAILDTRLDRYYSLNVVGAFMWERLEAPANARQIADLVAENYEVSAKVALQDVLLMIGNLFDEGLIERCEPAAVPVGTATS